MLIAIFGRRGKGMETWLWICEAFWEKQRSRQKHSWLCFCVLDFHGHVPQTLLGGGSREGGTYDMMVIFGSRGKGT
jgi:hypothetical protein